MTAHLDNIAGVPTAELVAQVPQALDRRDRRQINRLVKELVNRRAPLGRQWRSLALVMTQNGEHRTAVAAIRLYVEALGTDEARLEEVLTLHNAGRVAEARTLLQQLPDSAGDAATRLYLLGSLDSMVGALDEARVHLREAGRRAPENGQIWLALAMLGRMGTAEKIGDDIIVNDPRRSGKQMHAVEAYFHALGKVYADRDEHDRAFDAFAQGASLASSRQPYDPSAEARRVRQIAAGFDRSFLDGIAATVTINTRRPIFVTGNPRSGTTLVEQILTSHSAVADGAELDIMRIVATEIGGPLESDLDRYLSFGGRADDLSLLYLHLLDERFDERGRIVDKRLFASRTLGIISAILPEAPIIWLRRNPLDCAWSCFRTYFNQSSPWSHRLDTIAAHFKLEDELLTVWQRRLGEKLLVVQYEELVSAPAEWTRHILKHCGLPEEPSVFTPHMNERAVMTASVIQVREPINRKGIGVAEPYRKFMQPFIDAYYS